MRWVPASTVRYAVTSVSCLCLHNAIMITSEQIGFTIMMSATASFCIMVVVGYHLMTFAVFRSAPTWLGFCRYTFAMATNFPLATILLWFVLKILGQPMAVATFSTTLCMAGVNFIMSRWAVMGRGRRVFPFR